MQRIVAAVDLSEPSLRAADLAADLASRYDAELFLLTVGHDIGAPDPGLDAYARLEHIREPTSTLHVEALRDGLAGVRDRATASGRPARHGRGGRRRASRADPGVRRRRSRRT